MNTSVGIRSKVAILTMTWNSITAFAGIMMLIKGKWATICIACNRPHRRFIPNENSKFTMKLLMRAPSVRFPTPSVNNAKASVKALFSICFWILIVSVAFNGIDRKVSRLWKY